MTQTFDEKFRTDIPDTSKITGIYIDRAKRDSREPSTYVISFNTSGRRTLGTYPYRVPLAEALLVAKSRIDHFDTLPVVISGRASPVIARNKPIAVLMGLKTEFARPWSRGVDEYTKDKTLRPTGSDFKFS